MEKILKQILEELKGLNERVTAMESDMASERQQIEISQIVGALRHGVEEINAQLHGVSHNVNVLTGEVAGIKENVAVLDSKFCILNNRLL